MPRVEIPKVGTVEFPDSMSGDEISAAASKLHSAAQGGESAAPTGSRFPAAGEVRQRARKNLAENLPKLGQEQADQIMQDATRKEAIRSAEMLPFALAAPFTAGTSLAAGAAIMGGAGLAGGIGREVINATQGGPTKSLGGLAASFGIDAATGALSEVGGRGAVKVIEKGVGLGKTMLPKLVLQAGNLFEKSREMMTSAWRETHKALAEEVAGAPMADVQAVLQKLYSGLNELDKGGKGAWGQSYGGLTERAAVERGLISRATKAEVEAVHMKPRIAAAKAEAASFEAGESAAATARREAADVQARALARRTGGATESSTGRAAKEAQSAKAASSGIEAAEGARVSRLSRDAQNKITEMERDLRVAEDQISSHQSLDSLIKTKGEFSRLAWRSREIANSERGVFQEAAAGLDRVIKKNLAGNPRAAALYEQANELGRVQHEQSISLVMGGELVKKLLSKTAGRAVLGSLTGGAIGGQTGGVRGAVEGAAIGAVGGAIAEKATVFAVRKVLSSKIAAPVWADAVKAATAGNRSRARELAAQSFRMAGVPQILKEAEKMFGTEESAGTQ